MDQFDQIASYDDDPNHLAACSENVKLSHYRQVSSPHLFHSVPISLLYITFLFFICTVTELTDIFV